MQIPGVGISSEVIVGHKDCHCLYGWENLTATISIYVLKLSTKYRKPLTQTRKLITWPGRASSPVCAFQLTNERPITQSSRPKLRVNFKTDIEQDACYNDDG